MDWYNIRQKSTWKSVDSAQYNQVTYVLVYKADRTWFPLNFKSEIHRLSLTHLSESRMQNLWRVGKNNGPILSIYGPKFMLHNPMR